MHRFYCPAQDISLATITLSDPNQIHHVRDVLRLETGSEIIIFDDRKNEYLAVIEKIQKRNITCQIKAQNRPGGPEKRLKISVACAIPKKAKIDDIVDKLTQLGADRIIPLETERVIVKIEGQKRNSRLERWKKITLNACRQSQRKELPIVESIKSMDELLENISSYDLKLIFTLQGSRKSLKEVLRQAKFKNILLLIGPEGDFSPREFNSAVKKGCIPVCLGELVLRVDTACLAATSFIRLHANG